MARVETGETQRGFVSRQIIAGGGAASGITFGRGTHRDPERSGTTIVRGMDWPLHRTDRSRQKITIVVYTATQQPIAPLPDTSKEFIAELDQTWTFSELKRPTNIKSFASAAWSFKDLLERNPLYRDESIQGSQERILGFNRRLAKPKGTVEAFVNTCRRWRLEDEQRFGLLGYRTGCHHFGRLLLSGLADARSRDEEARIRHVISISLGLEILFGNDVDAENAWLRCPREELDHASPLNHMLEGDVDHLSRVAALVRRERGL